MLGTGRRLLTAGLCCCGVIAAQGPAVGANKAAASQAKTNAAPALYTQSGTDPSFRSLLDAKALPLGGNSTAVAKGSRIHVNTAALAQGANSRNAIPRNIKIHTLCHSAVARKDFPKWTRWYQEDGHTQIFRLFQGETNVRNQRELAARIEAFGETWEAGRTNEWHEWSGTFTIVRPHGCSIFQSKNNVNDWSVMLNMGDDGNIILNHRRHQKDVVLARDMTGKSFDLLVRDNGRDYEVFFNDRKVGAGYYDRPQGSNGFRWGMYLGHHEVRHDALLFVTGAKYK